MEQRRPLLVIHDQRLLEHVLRLAAAAGCAVSGSETTAARADWASAPMVLLDEAGVESCLAAGFPRRPGVVLLSLGAPTPAFPGGNDGTRGVGVRAGTRAVTGQQAEPAVADVGARQRGVQGGRGDPATGQCQPGPAQAEIVLGSEHEVEATAERIAVDEQRAIAAPGRLQRQGGGEHRCAGASSAAEHRHDDARMIRPLQQIGELVGEHAVVRGEFQEVVGADLHRAPAHLRLRWSRPGNGSSASRTPTNCIRRIGTSFA